MFHWLYGAESDWKYFIFVFGMIFPQDVETIIPLAV